jgi:hypothetical protein
MNSIELVLRFWLMLHVGSAGFAPAAGVTEPPLRWRDQESINDIVRLNFPKAENIGKNRKFSDLFNVYDLNRLGGFTIGRTENLLDHLSIQKYPGRKLKSVILIFHHVSVLKELIRFVEFGPSKNMSGSNNEQSPRPSITMRQ